MRSARQQGQYLPHDWFPSPIPANVSLGAGSWLYSSFAFQHCQSKASRAVAIGCHSGLYNGTFFDLGPKGTVDIGDYCAIVGAVFAVDCAIRIGSYTFIAHEVVFADRAAAVPGTPTEHPPPSTGNIVVGENVWVGARSVLLSGADIGEGAVIGAGTVVDFPVPPFAIVAGNPARVVGDCRERR